MTSGFDQLRNAMIFGSVQSLSIEGWARGFGKQPRCRCSSEMCLPYASGAGEQPRMVQRSRIPGAPKLFDYPFVAGNHGSKSWMASSRRSVTSAWLPDASINLTRFGSSAAMSLKARSTL